MMFSKMSDILSREALDEIKERNDSNAYRVLIDYLMLKLDYASNTHEKLNIIEAINNLMKEKQCMTANTSE